MASCSARPLHNATVKESLLNPGGSDSAVGSEAGTAPRVNPRLTQLLGGGAVAAGGAVGVCSPCRRSDPFRVEPLPLRVRCSRNRALCSLEIERWTGGHGRPGKRVPADCRPVRDPAKCRPVRFPAKCRPVRVPAKCRPVRVSANGWLVRAPANCRPVRAPARCRPERVPAKYRSVRILAECRRVHGPARFQTANLAPRVDP